jgi:hypothetical protein
MKICPHCDTEIPAQQIRCQSCGARYWESDEIARDESVEEEEEDQGCLSIFAVHFSVALGVFLSLLLIGFVINMLVHFEQNQIKVIWIGAALLLATAISGIIAKLRQGKEKGNKYQK